MPNARRSPPRPSGRASGGRARAWEELTETPFSSSAVALSLAESRGTRPPSAWFAAEGLRLSGQTEQTCGSECPAWSRAELVSGRWLADLQRRPRVTRLRVAGLAPGEVAELVADVLPADAGPDPVAAVVRAAEGNPLYAIELAGVGAAWPPPSITEAVLARAAGVAPPVQAVVDQVCVADGGMSHELLAATVPLEEDDLLAAAREAVTRRLLVATADGTGPANTGVVVLNGAALPFVVLCPAGP
jgi:hypothetical protein